MVRVHLAPALFHCLGTHRHLLHCTRIFASLVQRAALTTNRMIVHQAVVFCHANGKKKWDKDKIKLVFYNSCNNSYKLHREIVKSVPDLCVCKMGQVGADAKWQKITFRHMCLWSYVFWNILEFDFFSFSLK